MPSMRRKTEIIFKNFFIHPSYYNCVLLPWCLMQTVNMKNIKRSVFLLQPKTTKKIIAGTLVSALLLLINKSNKKKCTDLLIFLSNQVIE